MRKNRTNYEGNANDIHEKNLGFMKKVYENALFVSDYLNWDIIKCSKDNQMKNIDEIHEMIVKEVKNKINI